MRKKIRILSIIITSAVLCLFLASDIFPKEFPYKDIIIENVTRYREERIAYQHIQKQTSDKLDNSLAALLIIEDNKLYLLRDGYDDPSAVKEAKWFLDTAGTMVGDLFTNKINSKPDYIRITHKKIEVLKKVNEEFITKNFGKFFLNVRNALIQKHASKLKYLMRNRVEFNVSVVRKRLSRDIFAKRTKKRKYSIAICAKATDDTVYYAEDSNGDGITETFTVSISDGFHWGFHSGPNILFIYKNKEKDIESIIGNLTNIAYHGTPEEEKEMMKKFPKDSDIIKKFKLEIPPEGTTTATPGASTTTPGETK